MSLNSILLKKFLLSVLTFSERSWDLGMMYDVCFCRLMSQLADVNIQPSVGMLALYDVLRCCCYWTNVYCVLCSLHCFVCVSSCTLYTVTQEIWTMVLLMRRVTAILAQFALGISITAWNHGRFTKTRQSQLFLYFKVVDVGTSGKLISSACYDKQQVCVYLQPFSR